MISPRLIATFREEVFSDAGAIGGSPLVRVAVTATLENPWRGLDIDDLSTEVERICPPLARTMMQRALNALGTAAEAFGKAVVVGSAGETEHGDALIHNPFFSNVVRLGTGGTSVIASTEARGEAGTTVAVPLCHVTAASTRSHYQAMSVRLADAPHPGEIVVVIALAAGGRLRHRIGDRTTDPVFDPTPWRP